MALNLVIVHILDLMWQIVRSWAEPRKNQNKNKRPIAAPFTDSQKRHRHLQVKNSWLFLWLQPLGHAKSFFAAIWHQIWTTPWGLFRIFLCHGFNSSLIRKLWDVSLYNIYEFLKITCNDRLIAYKSAWWQKALISWELSQKRCSSWLGITVIEIV